MFARLVLAAAVVLAAPVPAWSSPTPPATAHCPDVPSPAPDPRGVEVTFCVLDVWDTGFDGRLTFVNHGASPVGNWELAMTVQPAIAVREAWGMEFRQVDTKVDFWQSEGGDPVPPGAQVTYRFLARKPAGESVGSPVTACSMAGRPCHVLTGTQQAGSTPKGVRAPLVPVG
ncbi:cellulose binding domain-containing protein [Longispora sp. K20-0274]|uniref:cellulose binding domain-containing protein n=1 Tax=Longispora sp. K20-0274 TaxID=3088255 RepID=UPI00399A880F